jgi:uncharacterized membrane protein (DUF373 family)
VCGIYWWTESWLFWGSGFRGYGKEEPEQVGAYREYQDPTDLLAHFDKVRRLNCGPRSGGSVTNKLLTLASEIEELRSKWQTLSIYEKFQQAVVAVLTLVIAVIVTISTWQLLLHTLRLIKSHVVTPADPQVFQGLFGMVLTVLIALEFKHTLLVVKHHRRAIVQVRAVVLIALLALVRRFIILDLYQTTPSVIAALAGAALALGAVFWLVGNHDSRAEDDLQE